MTKGMICFDMDGTIADFYSVPKWLLSIEEEDVTPYVVARPMYPMAELNAILEALIEQGWEIRVISWLPGGNISKEYKEAVRQAKIDWLKKYNFPYQKAHIIMYGTTKANSIRRTYRGGPAILIDDSRKVRDGWHMGEAIDPAQVNIINYLGELLEENKEEDGE